MTQMMRHNTSKMAQDLFSQIDTSGKGYIEKSDLEAAFQQLSSSGSSSGTSTADQVFSSLDSNSDGKITQEEMSTGLQKLSDALDSQFQSMRMNQAMGGMSGMGGMPPPPPPPENDTGFTKDQLQSQLDQIGSTDSKRSSLLSNIIANFDKADTDGDGKVSFKEAMAYEQSGSSSSTTSTTASTVSTGSTTSTSGTTSEAQLMLKILQLMHAYRSDSATTSSVTATA
jgi:Ca2+-binding EF-hand superfamily protein